MAQLHKRFVYSQTKELFQDTLIRPCVRENLTDLKHAQRLLNQELYRYNYRQEHSKDGRER